MVNQLFEKHMQALAETGYEELEDLSVAETEALIERFRLLSPKNRRSAFDLMIRSLLCIEKEEKEKKKNASVLQS